MIRLFRLLLVLSGVLAFSSCSDDAEQPYAHIRAFFRFTPVTAAQPLYAALSSPGEYCTITIQPHTFTFTDRAGRAVQANRTALDAYGQPECISGFIVGTPSTPDMNMRFQPLAYDLACPACYEYHLKSITLRFDPKQQNAVVCPRCHRVYDLSLQGAVIAGEPGPRMYWYRWVRYANNTVIIQN